MLQLLKSKLKFDRHMIQPQFHAHPVTLPENDNQPVRYNFFIGRGVGVTQTLRRWLEDGVLPILHAELLDGDIRYHAVTFTSLEYRPLESALQRLPHPQGLPAPAAA